MLALDIGNTKTRLAAFRGEKIAARLELSTRGLELEAVVEALSRLMAFADKPEIWVASVYPGANAVIDSAAERIGAARRFIRPGADLVMPHRLRSPETTGADRLLSALAAGALLFPDAPGGYAVIQCGSAATIDLVGPDGVFSGGYIIPGPALWLSGLANAALLPDYSARTPDWRATGPGDDTHDAILHGMALCLPRAAAAAVAALNPDGGGLPTAVTGGWGGEVARLLGDGCAWEPDLLLHGIRLFAGGGG